MTIGEKIRHYRTIRKMTQLELAKACGLRTYRQVQKWENQDQIQAKSLLAVAVALYVPLSAFLGVTVARLEGLSLPDDPSNLVPYPREVASPASTPNPNHGQVPVCSNPCETCPLMSRELEKRRDQQQIDLFLAERGI